MNFITAFVLLFLIGAVYGSTSTTPKINTVQEGSAFSEAGGRNGDTILSIDGKKTKTWDRAQVLLTLDNKKEYYSIEVRHEDNTTETLKVTPKETTDEKGNKTRVFGVIKKLTMELVKPFLMLPVNLKAFINQCLPLFMAYLLDVYQ